MDRDELAAWLRLLETPGVGRERARKLLSAFGSPEAVFRASATARSAVVGSAAAQALAEPHETLAALIANTIEWLHAAPHSRSTIALGDPLYPAALLETADPPLLMYAQGRLAQLQAPSLAIVGSRNPTHQGMDNARVFAEHLSQCGLVVVSGLALGIDGAAHEGALNGPGGTVAVVGTGLDQVYPRRNAALAQRIAEQGLLLSEYCLGTAPLPANFPIRNRIIAGLTRGTLVVEAALQSGSLITARLAAEAGRDVYAIPGSIHAPQSRGCHALIKQGAKLVDSAQDVLEDLRVARIAGAPSPAQQAPLAPTDPLLDALGYDPVGLEALVARTGWSAAQLNMRLLDLELDGQVARLPGQLFQRVSQG
ncbi:MAG: DNA-processing protein DprA [Burkholderiaceae bacterium]